jgi:hypothetical protein
MEWPTRECGNVASVLACNFRPPCAYTYWVIQNDCGQVWQLCTKMYVATV